MQTWKLFVLGRDKTPLPNCAECRDADWSHDRETCRCLTCHGFYAATDDPDRISVMKRLFPENAWAVRTGAASGIIVLDAEGGGEPSGVEVLDSWESWSGGWSLPHTNVRATTPSGGVHLYFEYVDGVRSRNRVLPGLDIKSDGGYVVIPWMYHKTVRDGWLESVHSHESARRWAVDPVGTQIRCVRPDGQFLEWLRTTRGRSVGGGGTIGHGPGYDYARFAAEGCPGGVRDEFFNELLFRMRKAGMERQDATATARRHWQRAAQPPAATWYMPWHHVEYKIERIWRTVEPDRVDEALTRWAASQVGESRRIGRVTLA